MTENEVLHNFFFVLNGRLELFKKIEEKNLNPFENSKKFKKLQAENEILLKFFEIEQNEEL